MSIKKAIAFTGFEWFYTLYNPLTPYGLEAKKRYDFIRDYKDIANAHQITKLLIDYITDQKEIAQKIEFHLKRIDLLNSLDKELLDSADLFLIKRLLINYKGVNDLLPEDIKKHLGIEFKSSQLLDVLIPDNSGDESFYLSSNFDIKLVNIRKQIADIDVSIDQIRKMVFSQLKQKYHLDFYSREFVLVDRSENINTDDPLLYCEFYDATYMLIKPVYPKEYMALMQDKDELIIQESELEKEILQELSNTIMQEREQLIKYTKSIELLDTYMTKARLAIDLNLECPIIEPNQSICIKNGRFLPLESKHKEQGLNYTALNAEFESKAILLSGSNMGGKTVLFKTIGFLQLLTQLGFWVPAEEFTTSLFDEIHILGDSELQNIEGLSSFGQEIHHLTKALHNDNKRKLLFVDEMAKTTNATEAKAILYGVLKEIINREDTLGFFSTHFINMPAIEGVSRFKMKGLNKKKFSKFYTTNDQNEIQDKIKVINQYMQYEIEIDEGNTTEFDAITIAQLLGLDERIIGEAKFFLSRQSSAGSPQ